MKDYESITDSPAWEEYWNVDQLVPQQMRINRMQSKLADARMPDNLFLQLNSDGVELNPELVGLTGRARELTKMYPPRRAT